MSSSVDTALRAMRHANPVPDEGSLEDAVLRSRVFLTATEGTSMSIDTQQHTEAKPPRKRTTRRKNVMAIVGGFALAVVAVAFAVTVDNDDGLVLTGADGDPAAREAFVAVEDAYETFNSGDSTWVEIRDRGSAYDSVRSQEVLADHLREVFVATHAAEARIDVIGCQSYGFGTWPDTADDGPIDGYRFTCDAVRTDSLHELAGFQPVDEAFVWVVADDDVIAVQSELGDEPWMDYPQEFSFWLAVAHPEIAAEIEFVEWEGFRVFPTPESLPTVLEYIDEYAAAR